MQRETDERDEKNFFPKKYLQAKKQEEGNAIKNGTFGCFDKKSNNNQKKEKK